MAIKVLVVDDSAANRKLLEARLQDEYFEVVGAASGAEAITLAQRWSPDIILLDVLMPVMDGFNATQYIRESLGLKDLPIIAMTANAMASDRDACLAAGMNDYLSKPFKKSELFDVISPWLRIEEATSEKDKNVKISRRYDLFYMPLN